ncbi:hypothetical protein [Streptomyces sp. NPDC088760]|uniref:hypothetical protein n=1 Tax=Streptomyces sp. NPDC088760 TaxID=3365890 RepID=UPI00380EB2A2
MNRRQSEREMKKARLKLAYESIQKQLEAQDRTVTNLRNRATGLFAAASFIVVVSTNLGLIREKGPSYPFWAATLLLALIAVQGWLVMAVIWPVEFHFGPRIEDIVDPRTHAIDDDVPGESLVDDLFDCLHENTQTIRHKTHLYQGAIACLLAEVGIVIAAIITLR